MHKLRNKEHKEILERILNIIPLGYTEPIFKEMKRKTRRFCASRKWDETEIRRILQEDRDWIYSFFDDFD